MWLKIFIDAELQVLLNKNDGQTQEIKCGPENSFLTFKRHGAYVNAVGDPKITC